MIRRTAGLLSDSLRGTGVSDTTGRSNATLLQDRAGAGPRRDFELLEMGTAGYLFESCSEGSIKLF
ncbi:MAG TPA: hypothetical protein VK858_08370 [Longimicrobiales bacterium]|nr:hypothetical protein [Longimicrobiales bacterium]